jgi:dTDP-glucose 4,6-dehydratase
MGYAALPENMEAAAADRRFDFARADVADSAEMAKLLRLLRPTAVFNFAAESHVDRGNQGGGEFVRSNVEGVRSLAEACRALRGAGRPITLVQVGTDEVYGSLEDGSATPETRLSPNSLYSATKAGGDLVAMSYFRTHGLDVRVTRCTNNYGPRQFPEKLIPVMTYKAMDGDPLPVYGDGRQVRDWIHVADHCRGVWSAFRRGSAGRVYHFAGGNEVDNLTVVGAILSALGRPADSVAHGRGQARARQAVLPRRLRQRGRVRVAPDGRLQGGAGGDRGVVPRERERMREVFRDVMAGEYARRNYGG